MECSNSKSGEYLCGINYLSAGFDRLGINLRQEIKFTGWIYYLIRNIEII